MRRPLWTLGTAVAAGAALMILFPGDSWLFMAKLLAGLLVFAAAAHLLRRLWAPSLAIVPKTLFALAPAEATVRLRTFGLGFFHVSLELFCTHEATLWGGGRQEVRFALPEVRRGLHTARVRFRFEDPFGFFSAALSAKIDEPFLVGPKTVPVGGEVLSLLAGAQHSGRTSSGNGFDTAGTRPYQPGDRLALVHWPQTVRHGQLHIRHRTDDGPLPLWLQLDTHPGAYRDEEQFELAVSVAASLAKAMWATKRPAGLLVGGRRFVAARGLDGALRALAMAEPGAACMAPGSAPQDLIVVTGPGGMEATARHAFVFLAGQELPPGSSRAFGVPELSALGSHPAAGAMQA